MDWRMLAKHMWFLLLFQELLALYLLGLAAYLVLKWRWATPPIAPHPLRPLRRST
jgi:hypothetical protein